MNIIDTLFQLVTFGMLIGLIFLIVFFVKNVKGNQRRLQELEEKVNLLERDKN